MPRWTIGVISLLAVIFTISGLWAQSGVPVSAKSFVIMDADTGRVLLSRNSDLLHPPASTLKVATALIALNTLDLNDSVRVSRYAASAPPSKVYLRAGKTYSVKDILYGVLLGSGNDAARAIAEKICGSESRFGKYMTKRVRIWGAYRSNFKNASGLPAADQYSTARDMALIMRRAMLNPTFAQILSTKSYKIEGGSKIYNHDRFLFTIPYAMGGKTGFTRASQHTYVGMFENRGRHIIISVMGSKTKQKWADRRVLIEKGFELCGTPIAQLAAVEEQLRHPRLGHAHKLPKSRSKKRYVSRKHRKKRAKRVACRHHRQGNSATKASMVYRKSEKKVRNRSSKSKHRSRLKKRKQRSPQDRKVKVQIRVAKER
ncbi:MAG: D-alanyl-D-alanine carboxypeptidase [Deltaproteobacteria bacterium]|nr:D-alanyl-D-alanine carboxypeptidase [Deltaproteobacteria bacterium]MBW1952514.1 D-alanyl-D-alanine carboxypeptidase [Deltaproteobacteria bacterium]MBW1987275.1 D-alanyl-D-alanine carboxypeptidase [Deltaproteobacteria bacterium]MBW2135133.1 D-alanyl-D-alanine carboxypeptidase [Deltaproteobacteria bacterium]